MFAVCSADGVEHVEHVSRRDESAISADRDEAEGRGEH
jgi:hypothetical protein